MARRDWLLMALAHREGQHMNPVQVQKAMFLLAREIPDLVGPGFYRFVPYNYGPFDADVYTDLGRLAQQGMVSITRARFNRYAVTPEGFREGTVLLERADPEARAYLSRVVDWVCSLSFADLVRAIYKKYPEYRANSVFAG